MRVQHETIALDEAYRHREEPEYKQYNQQQWVEALKYKNEPFITISIRFLIYYHQNPPISSRCHYDLLKIACNWGRRVNVYDACSDAPTFPRTEVCSLVPLILDSCHLLESHP